MVAPWSADERACTGPRRRGHGRVRARRHRRTRRPRSPDRSAAAGSPPRAPASPRSGRWRSRPGSSPTTRGCRSGRFALRLPSGAYVLLAATTPFRGHAGVDRKVDAFRVASGAARRLRLSLRRRGGHTARKRKARAAAGPSFVSVSYPAVWVQHFTVSGPDEDSVLRKGLADMLISDRVRRSRSGATVWSSSASTSTWPSPSRSSPRAATPIPRSASRPGT